MGVSFFRPTTKVLSFSRSLFRRAVVRSSLLRSSNERGISKEEEETFDQMRREIHKFEHRRTFAKVALLLRVAKNTKTNNHNTRDEEEEQQHLLSFSLFFSRQY